MLALFAFICGLVAMIYCLITRNWFVAVGFLGLVLLAARPVLNLL